MRLRIAFSFIFLLFSIQESAYAYKKRKNQNLPVPVEEEKNIKTESTPEPWAYITGSTEFLSNYVARGQTQTFGGPAVQGELTIKQKKEEGLFAGIFGSNVDSTTASNGSALELDIYGGYEYKPQKDLTLKLEIRDTRYPGAYAPLQTKDTYDMWEILPCVVYKHFVVFLAYQVTNVTGINQDFAPTFFTPIPPNGTSKGSWYVEGSLTLPVPGTEEKLKVNVNTGYWYIRHYSARSYAVFGGGFSYELPESFSSLILSVNGSVTTAQKKYYISINQSGQPKNIVAPVIWVGLKKEF